MTITQNTPQAAAEGLRAARAKADAYCLGQLQELQLAARTATAGIRAVHAAQAAGYGFDPAAWEALAAFRRRVDFCRQYFTIYAVKHATLSGRLPEEREPEAVERCATDDGMAAFLDEMARIPLGFVDPAPTPPTRN